MYTKYASNYMEATCKLEELLADEDVVKKFKSSKTNLFKEAMQYILPNSLLEPIYHCFAYFDFMEVRVVCVCVHVLCVCVCACVCVCVHVLCVCVRVHVLKT